jgi:hypothetical protein
LPPAAIGHHPTLTNSRYGAALPVLIPEAPRSEDQLFVKLSNLRRIADDSEGEEVSCRDTVQLRPVAPQIILSHSYSAWAIGAERLRRRLDPIKRDRSNLLQSGQPQRRHVHFDELPG